VPLFSISEPPLLWIPVPDFSIAIFMMTSFIK
jgi:hypothetical protein